MPHIPSWLDAILAESDRKIIMHPNVKVLAVDNEGNRLPTHQQWIESPAGSMWIDAKKKVIVGYGPPSATFPHQIFKLAKAPITEAERNQLRANLADLPAAAARKGTTLDRWDEIQEGIAGKNHFELGCWLYYYRERIYADFYARVDCARRIFLEGITNPGYQFFTAFDFGERQFDTIMEQGDGKEVISKLRNFLAADRTGNLRKAFEYMGWPIAEPGQAANPSIETSNKEVPGSDDNELDNLPLCVLQSAAGYYIGTANDEGPVSRESMEYWKTEDAAETALRSNAWTQRDDVGDYGLVTRNPSKKIRARHF